MTPQPAAALVPAKSMHTLASLSNDRGHCHHLKGRVVLTCGREDGVRAPASKVTYLRKDQCCLPCRVDAKLRIPAKQTGLIGRRKERKSL